MTHGYSCDMSLPKPCAIASSQAPRFYEWKGVSVGEKMIPTGIKKEGKKRLEYEGEAAAAYTTLQI
jgi:hypothetical protein